MNTPETPYVTTCPVGCTTTLADTALRLREGLLRRCGSCGQLLSSASAARYNETMAQFDDSAFNITTGSAQTRRDAVARKRLARIAGLLGKLPRDIRLCDVGCSRGQFVATALAEGFGAEGVEPAPQIAQAARDAGLPVRTGLLEDQQYADACFDALTLFEVVEHLRTPLPLLTECRRVLKPGGILLISTGNAASWTAATMGVRWDYFDMARDGGHISFFNPRSMAILAANAGFAVERIDTSRVKFHDRENTPRGRYAAGKLLAEALNLPARLLGRGHDMLAWLRKPAQ
ncbi:MAG: class I SAM-dependent methyltransferase [Burkholderiales bacterium]|nr:class I SAM-dependent methyltransferase [Burkholderiales bacterium]